MSDAMDVIRDIDQLRRDLSGYHGQLVAHNELQRHCENQRKRIGELEGLYADAKAENARLREQIESLQPRDSEGNELDIADTVHMLRSEWTTDENERLCDLAKANNYAHRLVSGDWREP